MKLALPFILTVILGACSYIPWHSEPLATREPGALDYYTWVTSASVQELGLERQRLEALQPTLEPDELAKAYVQLALLLSASQNATAKTEATALKLLADIQLDTTPNEQISEYLAFGALWKSVLEQRAKVRELTVKNQQKAEAVKKLQQQIDALTSIEEQLLEREQPLPDN